MNKDRLEVRNKIKAIKTIDQFEEMLSLYTLTHREVSVLRMHYVEGKDFRYIADSLGYSESTIKRIHKGILLKLS